MNKIGIGRPISGKYPISINGKITRIYRKWSSMIRRCSDPSNKNYYGKSIDVCERWKGRNGFDNFVDDMGEPNGLTLERVDNSKGYSPDNCKWATWKEQASNRSPGGNRIEGSLRQKAIASGLPYSVVYQRVRIHGWTEEKALSTPKLPKGRQIGFKPTSQLTYKPL